MRIETEDGGSFDLEMPLGQIGDLVSFFTSIADFVVRQRQDEGEPQPQMSSGHWAPIPVVGVGLGTGRSPEEAILLVRLAGFELAFALDGSKVAALGDDFSRTARTLSSGSGKPQ